MLGNLPEALAAKVKDVKGTAGRYIRIELPRRGTLTLAEVQVVSDGANIAPSGKARQSSVAFGGAPSRAIDGNTNGSYGSGTQTHTRENEDHPWWELDLGAERPIEAIIVWNRSEGNGTYAGRLDGFQLSVLDASRDEVYQQSNIPAPAENVRIALEGDPAGAVRRAAIAAIVSTGQEPAETFRLLARLIREGDQRDTAIRAISHIPANQRPQDEIRPLIEGHRP